MGRPAQTPLPRHFNGTTEAAHNTIGTTVYDVLADTKLQITNSGAAVEVANNDVILVDNEQMLVTNVPGGPGGCTSAPCTITVTRAYNGSIEATHSLNADV